MTHRDPILRDSCTPGPRAAGEPGRCPPPASGSSAARSLGHVEPSPISASLWAEIVQAADRAGLDPGYLLAQLQLGRLGVRAGLDALARLRDGT